MQEALAGGVQPAELGVAQRERMRGRVLQQAHEQPPEGTRTLRAGEGGWIQICPFVEVRELHRDDSSGTHTSLMRMRPGGVIPAHRHRRLEECIVLEGKCQIGTHGLVAGDVHVAAVRFVARGRHDAHRCARSVTRRVSASVSGCLTWRCIHFAPVEAAVVLVTLVLESRHREIQERTQFQGQRPLAGVHETDWD